ncbi:MAG: hypothetical protein WC568_09565, partial [Candidatus Methanoperedens sp.]
ADRILEQLGGSEKLSINELEKKIPLEDAELLDFMNECGLIELKKGELRITEFGSELLTLK